MTIKALVTENRLFGIQLAQYIWIKIISRQAIDDISKLDYYGSPITVEEFESLSEANKRECRIKGIVPGCINEAGYTIRYADVREIYQDTRWFILEPNDASLLTGCTIPYVILPYNPHWLPPTPE